MDNKGGGSTGIAAVLAIVVIIAVAALFVFGGFFSADKKVDINVSTPAR